MELFRKKNEATIICFPMVNVTNPETYDTGETVTDTAYYSDAEGAFTTLAISDTVSEVGTTGMYEISLTAGEMNHDLIFIKFTSAAAADTSMLIRTRAVDHDDLVRATTPANTLDIAATGEAGIDLGNTLGNFVAADFGAASLNGKGDWNVGKSGYTLTQSFPANFASMSITAGGLVDVTQAAADKVWGTAARTLTALGFTYAAGDFGAASLNGKGDWNVGKTGYSLVADSSAVTIGTVNTLTNLPSIPANWITIAGITDGAFTAAKFAAASLNGKGDWNIGKSGYALTTADWNVGKTGYTLTQAFPSNFSSLAITAGGVTDADVKSINGSTTAAVQLALSANEIEDGQCEGTPTITVIQTDLAETQNDIYIGRTIIFTSGNARGEATDITDYDGSTGTVTVVDLANAPAATDTFIIL